MPHSFHLLCSSRRDYFRFRREAKDPSISRAEHSRWSCQVGPHLGTRVLGQRNGGYASYVGGTRRRSIRRRSPAIRDLPGHQIPHLLAARTSIAGSRRTSLSGAQLNVDHFSITSMIAIRRPSMVLELLAEKREAGLRQPARSRKTARGDFINTDSCRRRECGYPQTRDSRGMGPVHSHVLCPDASAAYSWRSLSVGRRIAGSAGEDPKRRDSGFAHRPADAQESAIRARSMTGWALHSFRTRRSSRFCPVTRDYSALRGVLQARPARVQGRWRWTRPRIAIRRC